MKKKRIIIKVENVKKKQLVLTKAQRKHTQMKIKLEAAQVLRNIEFTHREKYLRHSNRFPI